jgi:general secretion pathway protein N
MIAALRSSFRPSFRPSLGWSLAALVIFIFAFAALMPLRFAAAALVPDNAALTAKSVDGSIWDGNLTDLGIGAFSFGDVQTRLGFLPLFAGKAQLHFRRGGAPGNPEFTGSITKGLSGVSVNHLTGTASYVSSSNLLPISSAEFQDFSARFANGKCRSANGSVRLLLKTGAIPGINTEGGFLGNAQCKAGALSLPMVSQSAMERIDLSIRADGSYSLSIKLSDVEPQSAVLLSSAGFQPVAGGYVHIINDRF